MSSKQTTANPPIKYNIFNIWRLHNVRQDGFDDYLTLRIMCYITTSIALLATLQQIEWPLFGFLALAGSLAGNIVSYVSRCRINCLLKIAIFLFMIWVLLDFFHELTVNTDTRIPLAKLLILLYTGHCFDLPFRQDVNYSLGVGWVLIAVGAVLTTSPLYGIYIAVFAISASVATYFSYRAYCHDTYEEPRISIKANEAGKSAPSLWHSLLPLIAVWVVCALLMTTAIFAMMPRYQSMRLQTFPSSWDLRMRFPTISHGDIITPENNDPNTSEAQKQQWANDVSSFSSVVDLDMRYSLSQETILLLRTNHWCYLRGLAFTDYNGHQWNIDDDEPREIRSDAPPISIYPEFPSSTVRRTTQIIQVKRDMPNLIFAAYQPQSLFLPTTNAYLDKAHNIRVPFLLEEGTVYSAVSAHPLRNIRAMQFINSWERFNQGDALYIKRYLDASQKIYRRMRINSSLRPFLQLPDNITERTRSLAKTITKDARNDYQRVTMLTNYLRENYTYQLIPPPYPLDHEVCDYFLFEAKVGNCNQFATALTVMARSLGIAARFTTGYVPNHYNPLTGYYEIRAADGHAWVEACLPPVGWLEFEPTSGRGDSALLMDKDPESRFLFAPLVEYIKDKLTPQQREALQRLGLNVKAFFDEWGNTLACAAAMVLLFWTARRTTRLARRLLHKAEASGQWNALTRSLYAMQRLRRRLTPIAATETEDVRQEQFRELIIALQMRGYVRQPQETMRGFAQRLEKTLSLSEFVPLCRLWEISQYAQRDLNAAEAQAWEEGMKACLARLTQESTSQGESFKA